MGRGARARSPGGASRRTGTCDEERLVVRVDAVAEHGCSACGSRCRRRSRSLDDRADDRAVAARERAELDVVDVVLEPPAVREAGEVARRARRAGCPAPTGRRRRRCAVFSRSRSAFVGPVKLSAGHAREQDRDRSPRPRRRARRRAPGRAGSRAPSPRARVYCRELARRPRAPCGSSGPSAERDHDLVDRAGCRAARPACQAARVASASRPREDRAPSGGSRSRRRRSLGSPAGALGVSCAIGTWSAIECMLKPPTPSTPAVAPQRDHVERVERPQTGRSNTEPRSTKNGSSRWPAKTLMPPGRSLTRRRAASRSSASSAGRCSPAASAGSRRAPADASGRRPA